MCWRERSNEGAVAPSLGSLGGQSDRMHVGRQSAPAALRDSKACATQGMKTLALNGDYSGEY